MPKRVPPAVTRTGDSYNTIMKNKSKRLSLKGKTKQPLSDNPQRSLPQLSANTPKEHGPPIAPQDRCPTKSCGNENLVQVDPTLSEIQAMKSLPAHRRPHSSHSGLGASQAEPDLGGKTWTPSKGTKPHPQRHVEDLNNLVTLTTSPTKIEVKH